MNLSPAELGTGFVKDSIPFPIDPARQPLILLTDDSSLPVQVDNSGTLGPAGWAREQGSSQACVPFELLTSLAMWLTAARSPLIASMPSPLLFGPALTYWAARAFAFKLAGLALGGAMPDAGTSPAFVASASNLVGAVLEADWPFDAGDQTGGPGDEETFAIATKAAPNLPLIKNAFAAVEEAAGSALILACKQIIASSPGGRISFSVVAGPNLQGATGEVVLVQDQGTENHFMGALSYFTVTAATPQASGGSVVTLSNGITMPCQAVAKPGDTIFGGTTSWGTGWAASSPLGAGIAPLHESFLDASNFFYRCQGPSA